jgi:hypothetical protein
MPVSALGHFVRVWCVLAAVAALTSVACAIAAEPSSPSKEQREKMAVLHEHMAACLRTQKPVSECRAEMMKGCQMDLGTQGCPMMMGGGIGMMGRGMMQGESSGSAGK